MKKTQPIFVNSTGIFLGYVVVVNTNLRTCLRFLESYFLPMGIIFVFTSPNPVSSTVWASYTVPLDLDENSGAFSWLPVVLWLVCVHSSNDPSKLKIRSEHCWRAPHLAK